MASKLPKLKNTTPVKPTEKIAVNLPCFSIKDVRCKVELGRGGFATVYRCCYQGKDVVLKELHSNDHRETMSLLLTKEARLLNSLKHDNIVEFHSICFSPLSLLMEYIYFDFKPFDRDYRVGSVNQFLREVGDGNFESFGIVIPKIAADVARGVAFLHDRGVAHRDLKPSNILISNQHYCHLSDDSRIEQLWLSNPVICKLTDFGESRSELIQTRSIGMTGNKNACRGTRAFMAPEICLPERPMPDISNFEFLKQVDIWALGLTLYILVNPSVSTPFYYDLKQKNISPPFYIAHLKEMLRKERLPSMVPEFKNLQQSTWKDVSTAYHRCAVFDASKRPTSQEISAFLDWSKYRRKSASVEAQKLTDSTDGKNTAPCNDETLKPAEYQVAVDSLLPKDVLLSRMRATLYGNCIGDAIGLLTELMTKREAKKIYGDKKKKLEYDLKHHDFHHLRWTTGDWTDDSDQMILILRSLVACKGKVDVLDFVQNHFKKWTETGYEELGDMGACGLGRTTFNVIMHPTWLTNPHQSAYDVWKESGGWAAPNGGVMRTSVLGIHDFANIDNVIENTRNICKVTHADPRCIASCVAVTTAITVMLQGKHYNKSDNSYDVDKICKQAYEYACKELDTSEQKDELKNHMFASSLGELKLDEQGKIGYTYKCLGAGFWAFRQNGFRKALTELVMEAGDADTNGAVAGALMGCKLGLDKLPDSWLKGLLHKEWFDEQIDRYLQMVGLSRDAPEQTNKPTQTLITAV